MSPNTKILSAFTLALLGAIQLIPYRPSNPPVLQDAQWDSPRTSELVHRACYDCHSNQARIPWYGHVAPTSWLVASHIDEAREKLNFSEMNKPQRDAHEAAEMVSEGEMPPNYFRFLHPEARLSEAEQRDLVLGLTATLGGEDSERAHAGGHHDDDD